MAVESVICVRYLYQNDKVRSIFFCNFVSEYGLIISGINPFE